MALHTEPVFVGATRPTMFLGVTVEFLFANGMLAMMAFLATNNILWLGLAVPLHGIAWLLCKEEPRMLSLLGLWSQTKGSSLNRGFWKASSTSPLAIEKRTMSTFPQRGIYNRENAATRHLPYTVMVDEATLRTTNHDLMRIYRIEGVAHESADDEDLNAWQEGLNILIRNIAKEYLALHTFVVRKVKNDYPEGEFVAGFSADLNQKYRDSLRDTRMLINELYIVVIYRPKAGQVVKAFDSFMAKLSPPPRTAIIAALEEDLHKLDEICQQVTASLERYEPELLTTYTRNGVTFSRTLELLGFLLNGEEQPIPLPTAAVRSALATSRLFFGKEAIEQRGPTRSQISGILSIKEYPARTVSTMMNGLLAAPYEFVLSQSFTCLSKGAATNKLKRTRDIMVNAGDLAESQIVQLDDALDDLTSNMFVMGVHNLSLQVKSPTVKQLSDDLAHARMTLAEMGMVIAREDVALEAAFWSQMPCNFGYRPRSAPVTSRNFAGFASLHNYPMGRPKGNYWGDAVALLKTASGAPYYFNFHRADLGNTTIIGPSGSGKTVTQGFLISMLEKFHPTMVFFDKDRGAEIFIRAQGGHYMPLKAGAPTGFNPFQIPLTPDYELFLQKLIKSLVTQRNEPFSVRDEVGVENAIRVVYQLPPQNRRIGQLLASLDPTDPNGVAARLAKWCGNGALAWVFDNPTDQLDFNKYRLLGFDITEFLDYAEVRTPIILYLFHRMEQVIDGRRFVCFIDEFWKALADKAFEDFAKNKLKVIRKQNGFLVAGTQSPSDTLNSPIAKTIIEQSPTQIFMPNPKADHDDYVGGFKLTEREYQIIKTLPEQSRRFLVKQGQNSVVAELNLRGFDDELAVLSGTTATVEVVQQAMKAAGTDPAAWLPEFHRRRRAA